MLLTDATTPYDNRIESQRGGVLFEGDRTVIATFGSKCSAVAGASPPRRRRCAVPVLTRICSSTRRGALWRDCLQLRPPPPEVRAALAGGFVKQGRTTTPPNLYRWQLGRKPCRLAHLPPAAACKGVLIAAVRTPDPYRSTAFPDSRSSSPPCRTSLYLRNVTDGRLEEFTRQATRPDRDQEDAQRISTVTHASTQSGAGRPASHRLPLISRWSGLPPGPARGPRSAGLLALPARCPPVQHTRICTCPGALVQRRSSGPALADFKFRVTLPPSARCCQAGPSTDSDSLCVFDTGTNLALKKFCPVLRICASHIFPAPHFTAVFPTKPARGYATVAVEMPGLKHNSMNVRTYKGAE